MRIKNHPQQFAPAGQVGAVGEQRIIRQKVENCLALRYPKDKLSIVVISDGSTDSTPAIVRQYTAAGIELIDQPVRRGKIANLNRVLPCRIVALQ